MRKNSLARSVERGKKQNKLHWDISHWLPSKREEEDNGQDERVSDDDNPASYGKLITTASKMPSIRSPITKRGLPPGWEDHPMYIQ